MTTKTKNKMELTAPESKRLIECEGVIEKCKQTFMDVGMALLEIKDGKLYRSKYKTFEQYTEARWGWGASRARQIIGAVQIQKSVTRVTLLDSQAGRELAKVRKEDRQKIADKAAEKSAEKGAEKPITAKQIKEAVKEVEEAPKPPSKPGPRPEKPKDESGRAIDPKAADVLKRTGEFRDLERVVHEIKREVLSLAAEDVGRCIDSQQMTRLFKEICTAIDFARPFTACPMNEHCTKSCRCCFGSQWITESVWKNVPTEFKKVRGGK